MHYASRQWKINSGQLTLLLSYLLIYLCVSVRDACNALKSGKKIKIQKKILANKKLQSQKTVSSFILRY